MDILIDTPDTNDIEIEEVEDLQKPAKRTPWAKKPFENIHATPAGPCISIRDSFNMYLDANYPKMKDAARKELWQKVGVELISTPLNKITDVIEAHIKKVRY